MRVCTIIIICHYELLVIPPFFNPFCVKYFQVLRIVYQDDILVIYKDEPAHVVLLDTVLCTLMSAGIKVNGDKCNFFTDNVTYLHREKWLTFSGSLKYK